MASKATLACLLVLAVAAVPVGAEVPVSFDADADAGLSAVRCAGPVCEAINLVCETVLHRPCYR